MRLGHHHCALPLRQHLQIIGAPRGIGTVDPHQHLDAGAQKVAHRHTRSVLVADGDGVLEIQHRDIRTAGDGLGEAVGSVAGGDEQDAARSGDATGKAAQRSTAGLWEATILSTTSFAVSAHAVVPPLAYSLTPSPTFHKPWKGGFVGQVVSGDRTLRRPVISRDGDIQDARTPIEVLDVVPQVLQQEFGLRRLIEVTGGILGHGGTRVEIPASGAISGQTSVKLAI